MKKNLLRTTVFSLIFVLCSLSLRSQWVSIPDTNFGTWLNTHGFTACLQGNNTIGWQMDTTCAAVVGATSVTCNSSSIRNIDGIQYFDNLQTFFCTNNQLTGLPSLPRRLRNLLCYANQLTSLPALPDSLTGLDCSDNQLTTLPPLPNSLSSLTCSFNPLSALPILPNNLIQLLCYNNQLTSLPALPGSLYTLRCFNNLLTALPSLPGGLGVLECEFNQLTSLPTLPNSLRALDCSDNQLVSLPALPQNLVSLDCYRNQLTHLPALPDSLTRCYVDFNPITCLPQLKQITYLSFTNTLVTCLPNFGNITSSYPALNTLPLCDLFDSNGCNVYWNISGKVYFDNNSNCIPDLTDTTLNNVRVSLKHNGNTLQQALTNKWGQYSFATDSFGTYTIVVDVSNLPFEVSCPSDGIDTAIVTAVDSFIYDKDFALECKPGFDLAAWSIEGRFRPGDTRKVDIHVGGSSYFYGVNCSGGITGTVTITITGPAGYVSPALGALTPDNVSGNVLTYNVADFGTVNFNSSFNIMVQTDTTAQIGDTICFTVTVSPVTGDDVPTNNIQTHCFVVVGSFDPNDKQVYPLSDIDVNGERWLTYTVNFQNTGTDTAIHIYITDTLDTDLDVSTFQLLAYSHQPMVQIKESAVCFNFPNIMLVDSHANEPLSHGYVQYKIKIKDGKPVGTVINNTAYIYFDFNAPVVTKTTTNVLAIVNDVEEFRISDFGFRIYPNPANTSVTIAIDGLADATIVITDITGREMLRSVFTIRTPQFDIRNFESGVYFVTVIGKEGRSATKKLVIQK